MKRLVMLLVLMLSGVVVAQAGFLSSYHPYPKAKKISVQSCQKNLNGLLCPHGRVLVRRTAMSQMQASLDLFGQRYPIRFSTMPAFVSSAWNADLNQDRKADLIVKFAWGGNGIIADGNLTVFALSSPSGYRLTAISTITFDPAALIFLRGKPVVLHTALVNATSSRTGRDHNFWVFHPLEIHKTQLHRNQAPVWIQYTLMPSHRRTTKLTLLEKQNALKADPIQFFEPIK